MFGWKFRNIRITFKAYWPLTYLKMKRLGMKKMWKMQEL